MVLAGREKAPFGREKAPFGRVKASFSKMIFSRHFVSPSPQPPVKTNPGHIQQGRYLPTFHRETPAETQVGSQDPLPPSNTSLSP